MKFKKLSKDRFGDFTYGDIVQFNRVYSTLVGVVIRPASMMGTELVDVRWIAPNKMAKYDEVLSYFPGRLRRYDEAL